MRSLAVLSAVLVAAVSGGPVKAAVQIIEGTEFETSGWAGAAIYDEAGTIFRACYMLRAFDEAELVFAMDKEGVLSIGLRNQLWDFPEDYETTVRFQLDDWVDVEVGAAAETPHVLLIPAGADAEVVQAFQAGNRVTITGELGSFEMPLTGTTNALPALIDCVASVPAQAGKPPLTEEEKRVVRALALYSPDERQAILEATLHPEIIETLGKIAEKSRQDFRALVGDLPRETQGLIWEVVRFPAMLDAVQALGPSPSEDAVGQAISEQPLEAQEKLMQLMQQAPDLIGQVHAIRLQAEQDTDAVLSQHPLQVESAFRIVLENPEALAKMNEEPEIVARIAEIYRRDPVLVLTRLEEVAQKIDAQQDAAVQAWAQQLEANPEAAQQLQEASRAYAEANGLPVIEAQTTDSATEVNVDADVDSSEAEAAPAETTTTTTEYNEYNEYNTYESEPYPYYYGPPPGYDDYYPYDPYGYAGYYINNVGAMVVTGLMTYAMVDWMFDDRYDHWDNYPDFTSELVVNVDRDNVWVGGGNDRVRDWVDDNRGDLPDGWFENDGALRERVSHYADSNRDFKEWRNTRGGEGNFNDFVNERGDKYPELRDQSQKLKDRKGGSKEKLGNLMQKDKGGNKLLEQGKLRDQNVLGGVDPGKKKDKLGGGNSKLLNKDKEQGGFVNKGEKKGDVKLQKKNKQQKLNNKKQRKQESWKGGKNKGKGKGKRKG